MCTNSSKSDSAALFCRSSACYLLILFVLSVATRVPFASKLLYHLDSVNFALALERYDLTVHQPHPPGYFLYVMLGRLLHLVLPDANQALVALSIISTSLSVALIALLAEEMYDRRSGMIAGSLALTSPNLWFHGEVALSYGVEACFSALVGLLCWKIYQGRHGYLWVAVVSLGIAGGIRQSTAVFLFPLVLYSARNVPRPRLWAALVVLAVVSMAWFVPMIIMTGGWEAYNGALGELWRYSTGHNTVLDRGWEAFTLYARSLYNFTFFSCGGGLVALGFAGYLLLRRKSSLDGIRNQGFLAVWALPSILFYLLIYIHPKNPGYALIFTPPLLLFSTRAVICISDHLAGVTARRLTYPLLTLILLANVSIFLFSSYPVSRREIKSNDETITAVVSRLHSFDPTTTAICVKPYLFHGFRQIMYYLPQHRVYQVELKMLPPTGRKVFWGTNRETFLCKEIVLPRDIRYIATVLGDEDRDIIGNEKGIDATPLLPRLSVACGELRSMEHIFSEGTFGNQTLQEVHATFPASASDLSHPSQQHDIR
jgi:hypothetical protein